MTRLWPILLALLILTIWVAVLITLAQPPSIAVREGEALTAITPGAGTPEADRPAPPAAVRSATPHSSRSRRRGVPASGRLTSTTCYVATGNRTASGLWPHIGMAASNRYPFGTRLRVEHVGIVTVQDRIGRGSELDLFYASRSACLRFGRRLLLVEVVR